ncbi:P-loop containing nucleoside triphosphate hydrolase protein [Radiomyces spectabilis]|uniref:P-loop containing nucleoside triphosphate hydrolase protein n=1 Tax=Radiomyces spectabilis TaxID=64574 RepID=UPI0022201D77|nr:P-loop containing nucleoside triphosphate hydrolase protein [Radiomyces spectabilis]KAI8388246.1 P-loop containing nucleoside triphosphate hydrolase protein [Radiomyces spectabilis]
MHSVFARRYAVLTRQFSSATCRWSNLIEFKQANIHRFGVKEPAFRNLSLTIADHERLVIVGPVSAGKSTLAEALAGKHLAQPLASAKWPMIDVSKSPYPSDHVHLVSFKEDSNAFSYSNHYYQERFNFSDPDNDVTLQDYLQSQSRDQQKIQQVAELLDIAPLLKLSFVKLSNGQTRRARIARALLRDPSMLILDEPLMGLDVDHRKRLLSILGELTTKSGVPVVLVLRPQDEFPSWATDVLELDNMAIAWQGKVDEYLARRQTIMEKELAERKAYLAQAREQDTSHRDPVVQLKNVNVIYSGNKILDNISWDVRQGEKWALLGPNGSGKTTLLSFLTGDHPQAYANELYLFGRRRGTGESIWEIKERVGLVSPEIHLYFNQSMTALEAAGTGFYDVVVPRTLTSEQTGVVQKLFNEFGINGLLSRKLNTMSTGEQRMVLLVRSLVCWRRC